MESIHYTRSNGICDACVRLVRLLAAVEKSRAIVRAERLRASIVEADSRGLHAPVSSEEEVRIGALIGVPRFPIDAQSSEALLEKADEAMYRRKRTGRNGVSFFGVDSTLVRGDGSTDERLAGR